MKKYLSVILGIMLTVCLVACGSSSKDSVNGNNQEVISNHEVSDTEELETSAENQQTEIEANSEQANEGKVAVVYFSGTGNTREVANLIAREAGVDIFEIIPEDMYTSDDLSAVSEYDVIYLGYPIWWGTAPRIIQTFIENCDISGSTVYAFCTSGGSGIEKSISDLQQMYPEVNIVDGKRLNDATELDIREWIESLN